MFKLFILSFILIVADADSRSSTLSRPKRPADDTVSNFFSELGDLFLDVDRGLAVQTAPKVEYEDNLVSEILRPSANYFDRIQKNYRNIQRRLGKIVGNSLGQKDAYTERELSTVSPSIIEEDSNKEILSTAIPEEILTTEFNPFAAADKERELATKGVSRGYIIRNEECSNEILDDPVLEQLRKEKCARIEAEERASNTLRKLMLDTKQVADELIPIGAKAIEDLSKVFTGGSEATEIDESDKDLESKSTQESGILSEECSNIILKDPILESLRRERCARIAAEQARRSLQNLIQEPKRVTEVLFPVGSKAVNQFSKGLLGRLGDISYVGETRSLLKEEKIPDEESDDVVVVDDECLNEISDDPIREQIRREKCARIMTEERAKNNLRKLIEDSRRASELLIPLGARTVDQYSKTFMKRQGDSDNGDLLPESFRQFLKDHGEWMLNNPLLTRWRQSSDVSADSRELTSEIPEATTVKIIPNPTTEIPNPETENVMSVSKSGDSFPESQERSNYYKIVNDDGDVIEEERVDVVFKPRADKDEVEESEEAEEYEPRDTVILAFTADGVPLKLRLGPEIDNPLRYLHKVLKSAGVSLNIPVESYDDIEPVGKEVLKLGSGILTRAVYIDVSNNKELKSLLKTLMKSKSSGKTQF